jgi:hypothetical protein
VKVARHAVPGLEFGHFSVPGRAIADAIFPSGGGLEHQIQGGGLDFEALHGLGLFLTAFAQQVNEVEQGRSGRGTTPFGRWQIIAGALRSVSAQCRQKQHRIDSHYQGGLAGYREGLRT